VLIFDEHFNNEVVRLSAYSMVVKRDDNRLRLSALLQEPPESWIEVACGLKTLSASAAVSCSFMPLSGDDLLLGKERHRIRQAEFAADVLILKKFSHLLKVRENIAVSLLFPSLARELSDTLIPLEIPTRPPRKPPFNLNDFKLTALCSV
jgi:hypothetical protein